MNVARFSGITCATLVAILSLALAACKQDAPAVDVVAATTSVATAETTSDAAAPADTAKGFDIRSLPISDKPLGAFPYFSLPVGYEPMNKPDTHDFDRFPFWVGDRFEWVEGRLFASPIEAVSGKDYSEYELRRNIEHLLLAAGGVKVADGKIPRQATSTLTEEVTVGHNAGLGDVYNSPVTTYVIHRADQDIWVHLVTDSAMGSWTIVATEPFVPTATLLPADQLKQQLDSAGKVVVQVNFATDKAEILPDSQPQLTQIRQLLTQHAALKLSVNGHTDNSGDAGHNQRLSEQRAQAVVAALTAQGIDVGRLQAHGFGASEPVADNADEAGKAKNRRVELVKH